MAFIRPYKESDFDYMTIICQETLPPSLKVSPEAVRLCSYIWTHQYTFLSPSTCFVVDDGSGRVVGYCVSCSDTEAFCEAYPRYVETVLRGIGKEKGHVLMEPTAEQLKTKAPWLDPDTGRPSELMLSQLAFSPFYLLQDGNGDLLAEGYKATLHIDLLDEFQGQGWGRKLLDKVFEAVQAENVQGSKGLWLGIAGENSKVVKFYEKVGFTLKEREKKPSSITMVRDY